MGTLRCSRPRSPTRTWSPLWSWTPWRRTPFHARLLWRRLPFHAGLPSHPWRVVAGCTRSSKGVLPVCRLGRVRVHRGSRGRASHTPARCRGRSTHPLAPWQRARSTCRRWSGPASHGLSSTLLVANQLVVDNVPVHVAVAGHCVARVHFWLPLSLLVAGQRLGQRRWGSPIGAL